MSTEMSAIGTTSRPSRGQSTTPSVTPNSNLANQSQPDSSNSGWQRFFTGIKDFYKDVISVPLEAKEEFEIRAEEREDKRYKERLAEQREYDDPMAQAQRLLRAGINPLAVMTQGGGLSQVTTSAPDSHAPTDNGNITSDIFKLFGMLKGNKASGVMSLISTISGLRNESITARSIANKNNAEADAIRNQETRNNALFPYVIKEKIASVVGQELANEYQTIVNYIADNTKEGKIAQERYTTQQLFQQLRICRQTYDNLLKDGEIKDEIKTTMIKQRQLLEGQIFAQEIANTLGVFNYEQFTGKDYYTGEKVGTGLAQFDYDKAANEADISAFEKELKEKELNNYDVNLIIDNALKVTEIADIIHDDIYNWMSDEQKRDFERELLSAKKRERSRDNFNKNNSKLFLTLLPYLLNRLLA